MKILHVVENLDSSYGGPATSIPMLVKYLNQLNITNKIFTIQIYENESNEILIENNIEVFTSKLSGIPKLRYSKSLKDKMVNEITDDTIIHVHTVWTYPSYLAYKLAKKYKLPIVVSTRGTMYTWALEQSKIVKKIAMFIFQKELLKSADVIHITEPNEDISLKKIGINNRTKLIPNGIELTHVYNTLDKQVLNDINYDTNKRYIMFLGRIVHNKGIHYLINSFKHLKSKFNDIELLLAGGVEDTYYYQSLERIDGIYFLGALTGVKKHTIFSISTLFVLPSKTENFGLAIAEAMTYKIPIVTTTGTPWIQLKEQKAGWWVDLNQKNITNAINEALLCNEYELKAKGNKCFDIISSFTWDVQAKKMKKTYEEILQMRKT